MKIGILTFTYGGDERILRENMNLIGHLRRKYPQYEIHHFIADDANAPFANKVENDEITHYFQTFYDRKGNLNGVENVKGQVSTMYSIQTMYDLDYIVKMDSDACLINLSILDEGIDYGGSSETPEHGYGWGPAYFLSRECLRRLFALYVVHPPYLRNMFAAVERGEWFAGEDVLIGHSVAFVSNGLKVVIKKVCENGALVPFHRFNEMNDKSFAVATKVGARFKGTEIDVNGSIDDIIQRMKKCDRTVV